MGWIEERGGKVRAVWRVGGVKHSTLCDTKAEANLILAQVAADRSRGTYIRPRAGDITVKLWAELWLETRPHLKASTDGTDRSTVKNHIIDPLGKVRLDNVTPMVVRKWVGDLAKPTERNKAGLAPKTIRNCHGLLHSMMQAAVDERVIATNPCVSTRLPARDHTEMRFLTRPEVDRLIANTDEHYQPLLHTLVSTGLRWGEAAGLRRRRVDILDRKIEVAESLHERGGKMTFGTPKSRAARRTVGMAPYLVDLLLPLTIGEEDEPIFVTKRGAYLRRAAFYRAVWEPALAKAELGKVRVHDLRHTHVSHLIAQGVPLPVISRRVGHASISVTFDTYGHLLPEAEAGAVSAAEAAFAPKLPTNASEPVPSE